MASTTKRLPPKVVHVNKAPFDIYIGREWGDYPESKWHNPFHLRDKTDPVERHAVLGQYETYIRGRVELIACLHELEGKTLGCWCRPYVCHGDVLANLFEEFVR